MSHYWSHKLNSCNNVHGFPLLATPLRPSLAEGFGTLADTMRKLLAVSHSDLARGIASLQTFAGVNLGRTLGRIELSLRGVKIADCAETLNSHGVEAELLQAAGSVKRLAAQINVVIHSLGILLCLPHILQTNEVIEYVSLGAGNTGKAFDLETNQRIAEFKFINWRGGPEAIRQNALFKDFYLMAEHNTQKQRFLYVLGDAHPLKFFNSGRAISSVLSRHMKLHDHFRTDLGSQFRTVRDYYNSRKTLVTIRDISSFVPELKGAALDDESAIH